MLVITRRHREELVLDGEIVIINETGRKLRLFIEGDLPVQRREKLTDLLSKLTVTIRSPKEEPR